MTTNNYDISNTKQVKTNEIRNSPPIIDHPNIKYNNKYIINEDYLNAIDLSMIRS